jgi:hypothetical protein
MKSSRFTSTNFRFKTKIAEKTKTIVKLLTAIFYIRCWQLPFVILLYTNDFVKKVGNSHHPLQCQKIL